MGNRGPIRWRSKLGLGRKGVPEQQAPSFATRSPSLYCLLQPAGQRGVPGPRRDEGPTPVQPGQGPGPHLGQGSGDGWGEIHPPELDFHSGSLRNSEAVGRLCVSVCVSDRETEHISKKGSPQKQTPKVRNVFSLLSQGVCLYITGICKTHLPPRCLLVKL